MEISSHYYATLALCKTYGYDTKTAHTIAYASQFVDDAKINYISSKDDKVINNIATAHSYFKVNTYTLSAMIYNTCAFHFVPACSKIDDSFTAKLICEENSTIINTILENNLNWSGNMN